MILNKRTQKKLFSAAASLIIAILAVLFYQNNPSFIAGAAPILQFTEYQVAKVVDGDTIKVKDSQGLESTVRLIGVNTPETVDPRKEVECFGKQASDYLKSLLQNQIAKLEFDASQGEQDKYGRLLAYVYLNNQLINKQIISQGFGYEYTYNTPYKYSQEFKAAQATAKQQNQGLWGAGCAK